MPDVKRRRYDATRRQERASANRIAMLEAAIALLTEQGYAATTLAQVAERAGLAAATAYAAFGNKPGLVKAAFDYAAAGDDDPTPVPNRERANRIFDEPDPAKKLEIYTDGMVARLARVAPLQLIARTAATLDPQMADVWEQMTSGRLAGMRIIAADLAQGGHLRSGVATEEAAEILWTYNAPEVYDLLVIQRRWTNDRYKHWALSALIAALLR